MSILYFDCFSGISGDMVLGALADFGCNMTDIQDQINSFLPQPIKISAKKRLVHGIYATDIDIINGHIPVFHYLQDIVNVIDASDLNPEVRKKSIAVFERLADSEAQVHGTSRHHIHFHELGALDTVVDVVGCYLALEQLNIDLCYSSPLPLGGGIISLQHGNYPLPAPAVLPLLEGIPCYGVSADIELVTPTGAGLVTALSRGFGPMPPMTIRKIGYGAGKKERADVPNLLRLIMGDSSPDSATETIAILETNVDDINPEIFPSLFEKFFSLEGALDMTIQPVIMKKGRPGYSIQWLIRPHAAAVVTDFIFSEINTLGIRHRLENRTVLSREILSIATEWGNVAVKVWTDLSGKRHFAPEYEACKALAHQCGIPIIDVYNEVIRRFNKSIKPLFL